MSIRHIIWAFEQDLKPSEKLVLLKLADNADDSGRCFPSRALLHQHTGLSPRSISRITARLESKGLLKREVRSWGTGGKTNVYHLTPLVTDDNNNLSRMTRYLVTGNKDNLSRMTSGTVKEPSENKKLHVEIISLYNQTADNLQRCLASRWKGSQGERALDARLREDEAHLDLEWWRSFFLVANANPTWNGDNKIEFRASLGWLVKRSNFDKVVTRWAEQGVPQ